MNHDSFSCTNFTAQFSSHYTHAPKRRKTAMNFCQDWMTFHQSVLRNSTLQQTESNVYRISPEVKSYFLNAAKRADELGVSTTTEIDLKKACFHTMVHLGLVVAEDSSKRIKDLSKMDADGLDFVVDVAASRLCVMTNLRATTDDHSDSCVTIIGRLPTPLDVGPNNAIIHGAWVYNVNENGGVTSVQPNPDAPPAPHAVPPTTLPEDVIYNQIPYPVEGTESVRLQYPLPVWRAMPQRTVWILVLKSKGTNLLSNNLHHVHRLMDELIHILQVSPKRQLAFGVLTNMQQCIFVGVKVTENRYRSYYSALIRRDALPGELAAFVSTNSTALGMPNLEPVAHFHPTDYVGSGSTATVVSGMFRNGRAITDIVLKTALDPGPLKLERWIIAYLLHCGVHPDTIPQVHQAAQQVLSKDYQQHCTAFQRRYARVEITAERLLEIWAILCSLHDVHVAHCDVRPPNMMYDEDAHRMVLIDFSGARIMRKRMNSRNVRARVRAACGVEIEDFAQLFEPRCVTTTSDAVLLGHSTRPADEACALIYAAIQINFPQGFVYCTELGQSKEDRLEFVEERWLDLFIGQHRNNEIDVFIDIVQHNLKSLHAERKSCTKDRRTELVESAVRAVYKIRVLTPTEYSNSDSEPVNSEAK